MKHIITDERYSFKSFFDDETGLYIRTGILDKDGRDTGEDPFMASFPHLIDVGVMGSCAHGKSGLCEKAGIGCYQSGKFLEEPDMSVSDFEKIAKQCKDRCNQFALGGRGDPDQHAQFEELLKISRENGIVPNFTTSGFGMTKEKAKLCKKYCGAVAVSWYRNEYTYRAIEMLLSEGVKTNIHYVLGNNSIEEAIERLEENDFPRGINAVIFLLHKPAGQGCADNVLKAFDPKVEKFFKLFEEDHPFKVGVDSCTVPGIINFSGKIAMESLDTCEGARFSCYISPKMVMSPCSFDRKETFGVQLSDSVSILDAWGSESFERFRKSLRSSCSLCEKREYCMGGCPLMQDVVLCSRSERGRL